MFLNYAFYIYRNNLKINKKQKTKFSIHEIQIKPEKSQDAKKTMNY